MRHLNLLDQIVCQMDASLRTLFAPNARASSRENPSKAQTENLLNQQERRHAAGLMRVNHSGEVCAQALYQGQAITAQLKEVREQMAHAAIEETDHLAWCEQRLNELGSQPSVLNPLWYAHSLMLGLIAGLAGDKWSLGFVAETERQVASHLQEHLQALPENDLRSKAIVAKMHEDEARHATLAMESGGTELPSFIKHIMRRVAKLMTRSSYYI